ncbi:MAG TPA: hypothetical protein VN628_06095 [Vicinamibacterales bacterium]|nr:hypothetical protein [Vicinamibacterales bacterium]
MSVNKVAFTAVGLACVAAAGAGGYLALRQNAPEPAQTVATATPSPANTAPAAAEKPVQETEAAIEPATPAKTPKKAVTPPPVAKAPARSATTASTTTGKAAAPAPLAAAPAPDPAPAPPARTDTVERVAQEAPAPPPPPQHTFEELVISADSVIGLQSDTTVTSERARVEDRVEARVTRDVKVADRVAIPAGSRAIGYVTQVEQGGKFKQQAKLAIRFQTIVLADGTRLPISTAAVEREGDAKGGSTAAKVGGGAVAGTILGAILGGGKGAAIGGLAGAGAGTAASAAGDRSEATLRAGEPITVRLLSPVTVTTESK